jgi:hypothetical protein
LYVKVLCELIPKKDFVVLPNVYVHVSWYVPVVRFAKAGVSE